MRSRIARGLAGLALLPLASACGSTGATVALAGAGTAAAVLGANLAGTRSKLEVTIERFDKSRLDDDEKELFRQADLAIEHARAPVDVVAAPTPAGIRTVIEQVQPEAVKLENGLQGLQTSVEALREVVAVPADVAPEPSDLQAAELVAAVSRNLENVKAVNDGVVAAWKTLHDRYLALASDGLSAEDQQVLAGLIHVLRLQAERATPARLEIDGFVRLLKKDLEPALLDLEPFDDEFSASVVELEKSFPRDDPTLPPERRIAAVVGAFIDYAFPRLEADRRKEPAALELLSGALNGIGVSASPELVASFVLEDGKAAPVDAIADALRPEILVNQVADQIAALTETRGDVRQATFASLGTDFNLGSVRQELMQVLLTSEAVAKVLEEDRWQEFASSRSKGAIGNHDAVVYFENLGLPVLKESAFDPTKFQVANGLLFRTAFSALADVAGLLGATVPGSAGAATPVGSVNLFQLQEEQKKAAAAAAERQKAMLAALQALIQLAESLPASEPGADLAKLRDDAKKAVEGAAKLLVPASSKPTPAP